MSNGSLLAPRKSTTAPLSVFDPFSRLSPFGLGVGRLFGDFWAQNWLANGNGMVFPSLDISEDTDAITVTTELPGVRKEDVRIQMENGVLSISGQKSQESEKKDRTLHRLERRYGAFSRSITLPVSVNFDSSAAHMRDGVLEIRLPKREEAKPRTLSVK
jgi:HSP20 family protein